MIFALLLAVIALFNRKPAETLEDVVAKVRYETKAKVEQAQAANLSREAIDSAIPAVAETLAASKPAAVEKPEQVVRLFSGFLVIVCSRPTADGL